jgi:hypothetical protein
MYSGTTLRDSSGNLLGAHQKIDRVARRQLAKLLPGGTNFPKIRDILYFEGKNGPDGVKAKSPSRDEPWHYINPDDPSDREIIRHIADHAHNLKKSLSGDNYYRAAFEAAWLAHAIVDGLTPAHHYPLDEKIEELWGYPKEQRLTIKQKNIIIGKNRRDTASKNWQYWGAKGVFTTHFMFEFGFATAIAPLKFDTSSPTDDQLKKIKQKGIEKIFTEAMQEVHDLNMYEEFYKRGWTTKLARQTREKLAPIIVRTVVLAWYLAASTEASGE